MSLNQDSGKRRYLQIAENIASGIKQQELKQGDRLSSERDFASKYEVSRQTIREALIALEVAGVVEIKLGSGIYVKSDINDAQAILQYEDAPGPLEILEARISIESEAAAFAAKRISAEEIEQLKSLVRMMKLATDRGETAKAEEYDKSFHQLIADASRNSAIANMVEWLWRLRNKSEISRFYHQKARELEKEHHVSVMKNVADHEEIIAALEEAAPVAAQMAMKAHIGRIYQEFSEFNLG